MRINVKLGIILVLAIAGVASAAADPPLPHWKDEIETMLRSLPPGAADVANVADPDASGGRAVEAGPRVGPQDSWHNYRTLQPGDYVATFRLKVADNTSPQVVFDLIVENGDAERRVRANEFAAAGKYQDFNVPFSIARPALVSTPTRSPAGNIVGWADCVTIAMLRRYGDRRQLELLGYKPPDFTLPADASGTLVVCGLYHEFWRVGEALAAAGSQVNAYVAAGAVTASVRGFPVSLKALSRFRLMVLADVPAGALTVEQRAMLAAYVRGGGGLILLGGPYAFGLGDWHTSEILAGLLPVTVDRHYDLVKCEPPQPVELEQALAPAMPKPGQPASGVVMFRHQLKAKPEAAIMVSAGGEPLVVGAAFGSGRVVAVLATPLGEAPAGQTAWWEWSGWPGVLKRVADWVTKR